MFVVKGSQDDEFVSYVESATRNEYWIDYYVDKVGSDLYLQAGRFLYYYSIYEFYITNASIELIGTTDTSILDGWSVDFPADPPFLLGDGEIRFLVDEHMFKPLVKITGDEFYVVDEVWDRKKISLPFRKDDRFKKLVKKG